MPTRKAEEMEIGQILVDLDGKLYEVIGRKDVGTDIYLWLWSDDSHFPRHFQAFTTGDDINFVKQPKQVSGVSSGIVELPGN